MHLHQNLFGTITYSQNGNDSSSGRSVGKLLSASSLIVIVFIKTDKIKITSMQSSKKNIVLDLAYRDKTTVLIIYL